MQRTIILHIGRHKSGTSSLQNFFCDNEIILEELGYYYPKKLRRPIAHHPMALFFNQNLSHTLTPSDIQEIDEFWKEIEGKKNIIISSEAFQNVDPQAMREAFKDFDLKIVVYLREQINYILSSYAQAIKAQKNTLKLSEYEAKTFKNLNYFQFITKWKNAFPNADMVIRLFEKSTLFEQDMRKDFLVHANIVKNESFEEFVFLDEDKNPSIGGSLLEFKRLLNGTEYDTKVNKGKLYRVLQNMAIKNKSYQLQKVMPEEIFNIMRDKYEKSNKRVSELYLDSELKIEQNIKFGDQQYIDQTILNDIFVDMEKEDQKMSKILEKYAFFELSTYAFSLK